VTGTEADKEHVMYTFCGFCKVIYAMQLPPDGIFPLKSANHNRDFYKKGTMLCVINILEH